MKKSSLKVQKRKRTVCCNNKRRGGWLALFGSWAHSSRRRWREGGTYSIRIVQMQDPTPTRIHLLVTLPLRSHGQCRVHVDIVTGQIQADQALEDDAPSRPCGREEYQQARGRAAIGHHVEHGAEGGGLVVVAGGDAVEGIEEAGDRVEEGAGSWVEGHVVERGDGEDDSRVACKIIIAVRSRAWVWKLTDQVRDEEEDVFFFLDALINLAHTAIHLGLAVRNRFFGLRRLIREGLVRLLIRLSSRSSPSTHL